MKTLTRQLSPIAILLCGLACLGLAGCDNTSEPLTVVGGTPAVPTGVYTITGDGEVEVRWNPVRGNNVEGYGVYRNDEAVDAAYHRIGTVYGEESDFYLDGNVMNGETYYYAVDAFNFQGEESELSYEDSFDTPRPAGTGTNLWAREDNAAQAGLDWSSYDTPNFVRPFNHGETDFFVQRIGEVLYAKVRAVGGVFNDMQDLGYTESMDEISWAPADGWSISPNGVELIKGHTYVVWTHDDHFAKFRVTSMTCDAQQLPSAVTIDWAYQIDPQNPELSPLFMVRGEGRVPVREETR